MSLASHAVNRLRGLWKKNYQKNATLNAETFGYSADLHSTAVGQLLEQLEPRVMLNTDVMLLQENFSESVSVAITSGTGSTAVASDDFTWGTTAQTFSANYDRSSNPIHIETNTTYEVSANVNVYPIAFEFTLPTALEGTIYISV